MAGALVFLVGQMFLFGTISAQCPVPCTSCKVFTDGQYNGTWNLKAEIDPRCNGSCLYERESDGLEMCFCDPGPINYNTTCLGCGCNSRCDTTNTWLVLTGGTNYDAGGRLDSTEIITSTGVCTPTIPSLPVAITGGEMAFMNWNCADGELIFCGGSTLFANHTDALISWGAGNLCYSLPTAAPIAWSPFPSMLQERAWFSLTKIDQKNMIAVGGIDSSGVTTVVSDSMEQYTFFNGFWTLLSIRLPEPRAGHCTVHYHTGMEDYLIVMGGVNQMWNVVNTVYKVDGSTTGRLADLPQPLFRPACTISCQDDIFVSGGFDDLGIINTNVYKYSFTTNTWSTVGSLSPERWAHVMGMVGASANRKMSVAGGFDGTNFLKSVEDSIDGGVTWSNRRTGLLVGRIFPAASEVPANTFSCEG